MKIILLISLIFLTNACGGSNSPSTTIENDPPNTPETNGAGGDGPGIGEGPTIDTGATTDGTVTVDNNAQAPAEAPQNLVGIAYTETEIEIFWERPSVESPAVTFRIYRDELLLDTVDALSYYQNSLTPATEYTYSVEPIKANNEIGPRASITLVTKPATPTINADNAEQVLSYLHEVVSGRLFNGMRELADTLYAIGVAGPRGSTDVEPAPTAQGLTLVESSFNEGVEEYSANCELGGQYVFTYVSSTTPDGGGALDRCSLSAVNLGNPIWGEYSINEELSKFQLNVGIVSDYTFTNFRAVNESWRMRELNGRLFLGANDSAQSWTISRFTSQVFEGQTTVVDAAISTTRAAADNANPEEHTREATFQIQAPETSNKVVYVQTSVPFVRDNLDTNFATGTLEVTGADGSSMTMNSDNGDIDTFDLTITADGATTSRTLPWSVL